MRLIDGIITRFEDLPNESRALGAALVGRHRPAAIQGDLQ